MEATHQGDPAPGAKDLRPEQKHNDEGDNGDDVEHGDMVEYIVVVQRGHQPHDA